MAIETRDRHRVTIDARFPFAVHFALIMTVTPDATRATVGATHRAVDLCMKFKLIKVLIQ